MTIKIIQPVAFGNDGNGIHIGNGVTNVEIDRPITSFNGADGILIAGQTSLEKLGFPSGFDSSKVQALLQELLNTQQEQRTQVIQKSNIMRDLLGMGADVSTITNNLLEIFSKSDPAGFITRLFQG